MKISINSMFNNMSGRLGDIVFRTVNGKTIACKMPKKATKLTPHQERSRERFLLAVAFAKEEMLDPVKKEKYLAMARKEKFQSAYAAALKTFLIRKDVV